MRAKSLSCLTLCDPMACSPLSIGSSVHGFSRQEYWSGLSSPPPGDLADSGIEPASLTSLAMAGRFFTTSATWEALRYLQTAQRYCCVYPLMVRDYIRFLKGGIQKPALWQGNLHSDSSSRGKWKSLSCVRLFVTPWTIQSMEFSRPEYWSG